MSYPNFPAAQTAYPTATTGVNVPAVVTVTGTGVSQIVTRNSDFGSFTAEKLDGQTVASANRGVQYVMPLAKGATAALTAGIKDAQGNVVASPNAFTWRSWQGAALSAASFVPPSATWLPDRVAPIVPVGQTGPGAGNGLFWDSDVVNVNGATGPNPTSGATASVLGNDLGYGIVEIRYPLDNGGVNSNNFIAALLMVTVTTAGTDVE